MRSLFPYVGGKHRVAKRLVEILPAHKCYVELFAGAANVLFAKERSKAEVLNDVNGVIVNLFRIIRLHPEALLDELRFITHSRQEFMDYHDQPGLTDVQRAARYWFLLRTTYGGTAASGHQNFSIGTLGRSTLTQECLRTIQYAHDRLNGVYIENLDFEKCLLRYDRPHTVFFCDPPYYPGADYGVPFEWADHERLTSALRSIKGKFLLTINDSVAIRRLYKGLPRKNVPVRYSVAPDKTPKARNRTELLIANYPLPKQW